MSSLSSLGLGLSLVVGLLLLALVAELYYLLLWKKRSIDRESEDGYSSPSRELFHLFCRSKPSLNSTTALNPRELCNSVRVSVSQGHELQDPQLQLHSNSSKHFLLSPFFENGVERELVTVHNLTGPPRLLFTIKEETKEDLESDDGRSRCGDKSQEGSRNKCLRDLLLTVETPFMTPLSSPPFFNSPITPMESYSHHGFNPLFESSAKVNHLNSSPPPKFKFLKDAEEKLYRRKLMEEAQQKLHARSSSVHRDEVKALHDLSMVRNVEDESCITSKPPSSYT